MPDLFDHASHVSGASYLPPAATALMPLAIKGTEIRRDVEGRYCLNDCHHAAGGGNKDRPSLWLANAQTKALVSEVEGAAGNPAHPVSTVMSGPNDRRGVFVVKELVYAYAMWISPAFHLAVIRAFDAMVTGAAPAPMGRTQIMAQAVLIAQETIQRQAEDIAYLEPRALALERLAGRKGAESVRESAKTLQMHQSALFEWLKQNRWAYKSGNRWCAYQTKIDQGYLIHREVPDKQHDNRSYTSMMITPKGRARIAELLEHEKRRK